MNLKLAEIVTSCPLILGTVHIRRENDNQSPVKRDESRDSVWSATVNLTPKANNRSNFQILSISYTGGGQNEDRDDDDDDDEDGDEDAYENDSWDDDVDEEELERDKRS